MKRDYISHWSGWLNREMHMIVYGHGGVPVIAFPCQDGMCDNWEGFGMQDTLADFIENGNIQLFYVDTVDKESWSDTYGDKGHRSWIQECYFHYITEEATPFVTHYNGTGAQPIVTGFSLGASHAAIVFLRRPDLYSGMLSCSGCYDTRDFWGDWMDERLYNNSPVDFMANMPADHHYINLYNQKKIIICVGQGAWENIGRRTSAQLRDSFQAKGINAWVDFWGYDVNHDWPWWRVQIRYFLPYLLGWQ